MDDSIKKLFSQLNSDDGQDVDDAIIKLAEMGINIDRDVYFSWDNVA